MEAFVHFYFFEIHRPARQIIVKALDTYPDMFLAACADRQIWNSIFHIFMGNVLCIHGF